MKYGIEKGTEVIASHVLYLDNESIQVRNENRRLYKILNYHDSKELIKNFIKSRITDTSLGNLEYDITLISVNPMRRSFYGNFYLDVIGNVTVDGEFLCSLDSVGISHVSVSGYRSLLEEEIEARKNVEKRFGSDQYNKEFVILRHSLTESLISNRSDFEELLSSDSLEDNSDLINELTHVILKNSGWESDMDNRLQVRLKRLPPYLEIPE